MDFTSLNPYYAEDFFAIGDSTNGLRFSLFHRANLDLFILRVAKYIQTREEVLMVVNDPDAIKTICSLYPLLSKAVDLPLWVGAHRPIRVVDELFFNACCHGDSKNIDIYYYHCPRSGVFTVREAESSAFGRGFERILSAVLEIRS